jgi:xylulokinase
MREETGSGRDVYDLIVGGASPEASSLFILPHFVGSGTPTLDPLSSGAILGLSLATRREDVSRSVLDSLNYELRLNIETLEELGIPIEEIRAVGGGAKSTRWLQMKADVFGKPVTSLALSEAPCLGAALLAGAAIGTYESVDEGVSTAVRVGDTYEPDMKAHTRYTEKFEVYRKIYPVLRRIDQEREMG